VRLIDFGLSACGKLASANGNSDGSSTTTTTRARSVTVDGRAVADNPNHVSTHSMRQQRQQNGRTTPTKAERRAGVAANFQVRTCLG
jgi:hypothetical protein